MFLKTVRRIIIMLPKQNGGGWGGQGRVEEDYLLSDTAQSFPGLCQPFLWETGSLESSVTKQTSKQKGDCQKPYIQRDSHDTASMENHDLNHKRWERKE